MEECLWDGSLLDYFSCGRPDEKYVNIVDYFNYIMMVRGVFILNESRGKLEIVEKKERKPRDFRVGENCNLRIVICDLFVM